MSKIPKRILLVLEHFYPYVGGVETLFWDLCNKLVHQGYQVKVITTRHDQSLPMEEVINGISVKRLAVKNRYFFSILGFFSTYKYAKNFDIIHTTTYNAALPAYLAARIRRKKIVITWHEYWNKLWFKLPYISKFAACFFYIYEQMINRLSFDQIIAVSEYTAKQLNSSRRHKDKITNIYNGLDYPYFENIKSHLNHQIAEPYCIFVGRLGISKGINILIESYKNWDNNRKIKLKMVIPKVPHSMFKKVISQIKEAGLSQEVELYHELSKQDLLQMVCKAKFIIIPSYSEGFCFVAAEASAIGTPIVHSGQGALVEVVSNQFINCDSTDPKDFTEAYDLALQSEFKYKKLKKFTLDEAVESYTQLYNKLTHAQ
ncbi:MAG: glycosyltransferase family 4 protein [Saprospiraceae bacterium]